MSAASASTRSTRAADGVALRKLVVPGVKHRRRQPIQTREQRSQAVLDGERVLAGDARLKADAELAAKVGLRHQVEECLEQTRVERAIRRRSSYNDCGIAHGRDRFLDLRRLPARQQSVSRQPCQIDQARLAAKVR